MPNLLRKLLLLTFGLLFTVALGELGLRLVGRSLPAAQPKPTGLIRQEQRTGWLPSENARQQGTDPDGDVFLVRTNATGQRGAEIPERLPHERRILLLGDSFTMASQLPEEDTFVDQLGQLLSRQGDHPVRTINGGVSGYGTYQELAYYRYYGRLLTPDLVLLCVFLGNDFRDNAVETRQGHLINPVLVPGAASFRSTWLALLRGDDGRPVRDPLSAQPVARPASSALAWMARGSHLTRLVLSRSSRLMGRIRGDIGLIDLDSRYFFYEIGLYQQLKTEPFPTARALTLECLEQLRLTVLEDGADLMVVLLPSQSQVDPDRWQQDLDDLGIRAADLGPLDMRATNRLISDYCRSRRVSCLDLTDLFAAADQVSQLYLTAIGNRPLSAAGHRLAATEMARFLQDQQASGPTPGRARFYRGLEQGRRGNWDQAERGFSVALERNPDWAPPHMALGLLHLAREEWPLAEAALLRALALQPESRRSWEGLARARAELGDTVGATQAFSRALKLHPDWWPYHRTLAALYQAQGRRDLADAHTSRADSALHATDAIRRFWWAEHISAGTEHAAARRWDSAEREFRSATLFFPAEPVSYHNLGLLFQHSGRPQRAIAAYRSALQLAPDFVPAQQKLAELE
jgi:tetratricopeptide (TPR) repeat protein